MTRWSEPELTATVRARVEDALKFRSLKTITFIVFITAQRRVCGLLFYSLSIIV